MDLPARLPSTGDDLPAAGHRGPQCLASNYLEASPTYIGLPPTSSRVVFVRRPTTAFHISVDLCELLCWAECVDGRVRGYVVFLTSLISEYLVFLVDHGSHINSILS